MPAHNKPNVYPQPVVDEWGIYDPDRAGLAAVFAIVESRHPHHPAPAQTDNRAATAVMRVASDPRVKN